MQEQILQFLINAMSKNEKWIVPSFSSDVVNFLSENSNDEAKPALSCFVSFSDFSKMTGVMPNDLNRVVNEWIVKNNFNIEESEILSVIWQRIIFIGILPEFAKIIERERILDYRDIL